MDELGGEESGKRCQWFRQHSAKWAAIECTSYWKALPHFRMKYTNDALEQDYHVFLYKDSREVVQSLALAGSLCMFISLIIRTPTRDAAVHSSFARVLIPLPFAVVIFMYVAFNRRLIDGYVWWRLRTFRDSSSSSGGDVGAARRRYVLQYLEWEWAVSFVVFFLAACLMPLHGRYTYTADDGFTWSTPRIRCFRYYGVGIVEVLVLCLGWLIFKCSSFPSFFLVLGNLIMHFVLEFGSGVPNEPNMEGRSFISYTLLAILLICGSRQMELVCRTMLYQKHKVACEKEAKRQLLESFAQMVGIAAWEWDTRLPVRKACYQTRVIAALTGRPPTSDDNPAESVNQPRSSPSGTPESLPSFASAHERRAACWSRILSLFKWTCCCKKKRGRAVASRDDGRASKGREESSGVCVEQCVQPERKGEMVEVVAVRDEASTAPSANLPRPERDAGAGVTAAVGEEAPATTSFPCFAGFWTSHVVPSDRDKIEQAIVKCAEDGQPFEIEIMYERADGQVRWFRCGGRKEQPQGALLYGFIKDVTEVRRASKAQEKQLHLLQRVADATLDATAVVDLQEEMIVESSPLLNLWQRRPMEGASLCELLDASTIKSVKIDVSICEHPPALRARIHRRFDNTQAECQLLAFVDENDPAMVFLGFQNLRSSSPPFLPLKLLLVQPPSRRQPPPSTSTQQASTPSLSRSVESHRLDEAPPPPPPSYPPPRLSQPQPTSSSHSHHYHSRQGNVIVQREREEPPAYTPDDETHTYGTDEGDPFEIEMPPHQHHMLYGRGHPIPSRKAMGD
ncbi:unnamed protein product [Vitrella brassicaformis CCMP3155]|uniref:PAS fold-3 domain-containing protein n=3 Tax=Vitrella brassicaformis TaxID=1169539 RepID=A0A0G4H1Z5_VITBC|nr:unnamed protein product [Vitrella brassicaformis CCMP3155]|eukprot:CEM37647.1 unnamed protein product [Vitrella brassicaformis CCMP3155]